MASKNTQDRKSYGQLCPMATALDVIGDRWTPLILRELLGGPARFNELQQGLPGIAKNLLTSRLRRLEADGIIRRTTSHATTLYALTDQGATIRPVLEQLAFWGAKLTRPTPAEHNRSVRAIAMALQAILTRSAQATASEPLVIELEIDGEPVDMVLGPRPTATARPSTEPNARVQVAASTMAAFFGGASVDAELFILTAGDRAARTALLRTLGLKVS